MSRQRSTTRCHRGCRMRRCELYCATMHPTPCVHATAISHRACHRVRCAADRAVPAASRTRARPRRVRHRSCMASCSSAYKPKDFSRTARRSPMRPRNPRPKKSCADTKRSKDLARIFAAGLRRRRTSSIPGAVGERFPDRAARGNPRAHRQAVGRADAHAARFARRRVRCFGSRPATSCPAGAFARCTTGIPTSRWWACRPAAATISWPTWSRTLPGLIDRYGHIPNGSRSYYLSRSQPPFFAAMVELQAEREGARALIRRLPQLEREYASGWRARKALLPAPRIAASCASPTVVC